MWAFVAAHVTKVGGGSPTPSAMQQLLEKVDADPDWYPGKAELHARGPKSVITARNQNVVAQSAMSMKARGEEPVFVFLTTGQSPGHTHTHLRKPIRKGPQAHFDSALVSGRVA